MKKIILQMTKRFAQISLICASLCFCLGEAAGQIQHQTFETAGNHTFNIPDGVSEVTIEVVGGGGAGGFVYSPCNPAFHTGPYGCLDVGDCLYDVSGGGSGGCYAKTTLALNSSVRTLEITVGEGGVNRISATGGYYGDSWSSLIHRDGGASSVSYGGTVVAKANGGISVSGGNNHSGAAAPSTTGCIGSDVVHPGGRGGNAARNCKAGCIVAYGEFSSGGGGGAGCYATAGGEENIDAACAQNTGWGHGGTSSFPGGNGGRGTSDYNNSGGGNPIGEAGTHGGGGGGSKCGGDGTSPHSGGGGGVGIVYLTWEVCASKPVVNSIAAPTDLCPGKTTYNVLADITPGAGAITEYNWNGATGVDATGVVAATVPNCAQKYEYSLKVKDEFGCESNTGEGFFFTESPSVTFGEVAAVEATVVPHLESLLNNAAISTCSNPVYQYTCNPPEGTAVAEGTSVNVVADVTDFCGRSHTVVVPFTNNTGGGGGGGSTSECPLTITANYITVCEGSSATLTATVSGTGATGTPTYTWTPNISTSNTATTPATAAAGTHSYTCQVSFPGGCTSSYTINITTIGKPAETAQTGNICTGESYSYGTSGVTYTWTVTDADGTDAAAETTPQSEFNVTVNNTGDASATVVYSVTPHKIVGSTDCEGDAFTVTLTVKPSIANATFNFSASDIVKTLWYGKCDTLVINDLPTYSTSITEYDGLLTVSVSPGIINSDNKLEVRLPAGEHTITWTFTDPCGNSVVKTQNVTINYPECTGTVNDGSGNTYEVVRVGCECWTKSNLKAEQYATNLGGGDIASAEGYFSTEYPNTDENIDKFGRLYTWYSAVNVAEGDDSAEPTLTEDGTSHIKYVQGICPEGWAIPTTQSFENAYIAAGGVENLKTTDGSLWLPGENGTNASGFSAVGAGLYDSNIDRYINLLGETYWWNEESVSVSNAACSSITHTCPYILAKDMNKHFGLSVRCVKRAN